MLIQFPAKLLTESVENWAEWFFDRPVGDSPDGKIFDAESDWLDESEWTLPEGITPESVLLERMAELHERYAEWATRYSAEQLDQGLWAMFSFPCFLGELLLDEDLPIKQRTCAMRSLIVPYQEYVKGWNPIKEMPGGWWMLWDLILGYKNPRDMADIALACLQEILAIPDKRCQASALHGLNHLQHPDRPAVVQRWIDQYATSDNIEWLEACREGKAM